MNRLLILSCLVVLYASPCWKNEEDSWLVVAISDLGGFFKSLNNSVD